MFRFVLPALLALTPCVALASDTAAINADVAEAAPAAPAVAPRKICSKEKAVGTNRPVRVCRNAADVEQVGDATREAYGRAMRERYMPTMEELGGSL